MCSSSKFWEGGGLKTNIFNGKYEADLEFLEEWKG